MFFANEQRDKVREDNPGIKFGKSQIDHCTVALLLTISRRGWQASRREVEDPQRQAEGPIRGQGRHRQEAIRRREGRLCCCMIIVLMTILLFRLLMLIRVASTMTRTRSKLRMGNVNRGVRLGFLHQTLPTVH